MLVGLISCALALSSWHSVSAVNCGGTFTNVKGTIKSPNFPDQYPPNSDCIYRILASPDARLRLTCSKMNIESSTGCTNDYLKVNGVFYCGKNAPKYIYTEGEMIVEFKSNKKIKKRGFSCVYTRVTGGPYVETTTTASTTAVSTTAAPTTETPTTTVPTTETPTTTAPTTEAPTTAVPTTEAPTTAAPTTAAPTTEAPTTAAPTTEAPTTEAPTTAAPTTVAPTTEAPTTVAPTTEAPTTVAPTTEAPTTVVPTTDVLTTDAATPESISCDDFLSLKSSWNTGWDGKVHLPIQTSISSWKVEFEFTAPVSSFEQWTGNQTTLSSTLYSVTKEEGLNVGTTLTFDFLYRWNQGDTVPSLRSIKLNDEEVCNEGGTAYTTQQPETGTFTTVSQAPYTGPGCAASGSSYNYDEVLHKSLLFYEAQRSGYLPATQRVTWRHDSATDDAKDANQQINLEGGYYDAGDYVKFGYPMAGMTTVLAWGAIEYGAAYTAAGEMTYMREAVKWATDYFIKAHKAPNVFYGQVGDGDLDHAYWGQPEDMTMERPAFKIDANNPGSDLAGETAAALAATSILFNSSDPTYAATCLQHAEELYNFANKYKGKYADSITDAASFYYSYGTYFDELAWAAAWLYRATGRQNYLTDAKSHYSTLSSNVAEFSWAEKTPGVQVLLAELADPNDRSTYANDLQSFCDKIVYNTERTPKGLVFISKWGSLRYAANAVFVCLRAADLGIKSEIYRDFGKEQIHYMLGDAGRSFVVGFGNNPPVRPHHSSSACPPSPTPCGWDLYRSPDPNFSELTGALVGGPDANDNYEDKRDDYISNEVTTDYNAGFQGAVAALRLLANCESNTATQPQTTRTSINTQSTTEVPITSDSTTESTSTEGQTTSGQSSTSPSSVSTTSLPTTTYPSVTTVPLGEGTACNTLTAETSSWNTGWSGNIKIPIQETLSAWDAEIEFTSPLENFKQWIGSLTQESDTLYKITKAPTSLSSGELLSFQIVYNFASGEDIPAIKSIKFNGEIICIKPEEPEPTPPPGGYVCTKVTQTNEWNGNLQLNLDVTFPTSVSSWKIDLVFSENIDTINAYTAQESDIDGNSVTLSNESYNGQQDAGDSLVLGIHITYSSAVKPMVEAVTISGIDVCSEY